jgi:hypothetical protein
MGITLTLQAERSAEGGFPRRQGDRRPGEAEHHQRIDVAMEPGDHDGYRAGGEQHERPPRRSAGAPAEPEQRGDHAEVRRDFD